MSVVSEPGVAELEVEARTSVSRGMSIPCHAEKLRQLSFKPHHSPAVK